MEHSDILTPVVDLTQKAAEQILLMKQSDPTLENLVFRLSIEGKGCDGFVWGSGFSSPHKDDLIYKSSIYPIEIHFDPFCAQYFQKGAIDFLLNPQSDEEGFIIESYVQEDFKGKFWRR